MDPYDSFTQSPPKPTVSFSVETNKPVLSFTWEPEALGQTKELPKDKVGRLPEPNRKLTVKSQQPGCMHIQGHTDQWERTKGQTQPHKWHVLDSMDILRRKHSRI